MISPLLEVIEIVPNLLAIPTFQQMVRNTQATWLRYPDLATVTRVGESGQGEPIDMISIGDGPMSALFVGAPHPNETVGCLVIEHLIDRLCSDHALRQALPYRWHFIKAIDSHCTMYYLTERKSGAARTRRREDPGFRERHART